MPAKRTGSDIEWHRDMLADRHRVESFWRVLSEAVGPDDIVVDIGTGTGLLALMAARAGASRVYAIERGDIIELARDIARRNGLDDRIEFVRGDSRQVDLPERADLVIGEVVGSLGVDEEIIDIFGDARRRFLKSGGRLLPDSLDLIAAPTEEGERRGSWEHNLETDCSLDFSPFSELLCPYESLGGLSGSERSTNFPFDRTSTHRTTPSSLEEKTFPPSAAGRNSS